LFVPVSARLRENGWTDLHEIFREGVQERMTMGFSFGSFRRNNAMPGAGFVVLSHHSLFD